MIRRFINWRRRRHLTKVIRFLNTCGVVRLSDDVLVVGRVTMFTYTDPLFGTASMGQRLMAINEITDFTTEQDAIPITKKWIIPHIQAYINLRS